MRPRIRKRGDPNVPEGNVMMSRAPRPIIGMAAHVENQPTVDVIGNGCDAASDDCT